MSWWRWVRRGVVALVVGVVVTYGVAWGFALTSAWTCTQTFPETWPRQVPPRWANPLWASNCIGIGVRCEAGSTETGFGTAHDGFYCCVKSGWPSLGLKSDLFWERRPGGKWQITQVDGNAGWKLASGIKFPFALGVVDSTPQGRERCQIQLIPLWPGFVIDVMFYAGTWLTMLYVVGAVRRWRRVRRGQCGGCGYDVRGIAGGVCPECGGGVEDRKRSEMVKE